MLQSKCFVRMSESESDLSSFPHTTPQAPVKTNPFLEELRTLAVKTFAYEKECDEKYGPAESTLEENDKEKNELTEAIVNCNKKMLLGHVTWGTTVREPFRVGLWGQGKFPDIRDIVWHKLCLLGLDLYLCPYGNIYVNPSSWLSAKSKFISY